MILLTIDYSYVSFGNIIANAYFNDIHIVYIEITYDRTNTTCNIKIEFFSKMVEKYPKIGVYILCQTIKTIRQKYELNNNSTMCLDPRLRQRLIEYYESIGFETRQYTMYTTVGVFLDNCQSKKYKWKKYPIHIEEYINIREDEEKDSFDEW